MERAPMMGTRLKCEFLGWPIFASFRLSLAEQAHDILCHEIHAGRWKIGERLPSISALAQETGMIRGPIQRAFEMLRKEGYVRQQGRNGTTLISLAPDKRTPIGAIGILTVVNWLLGGHMASGPDHLRFHDIMEAARVRNCVTEVVCLKADADWQGMGKRGGLFSDRVLGVIALCPFPHSFAPNPPANRIPLVFLGDPCVLWEEMDEESLPFVTGDLFEAIYRLTQRVISNGHRKIALYAAQGQRMYGFQGKSPQYTSTCWRAHERAMREMGLRADREAFEESLSLPRDDFAAYRQFLQNHSDLTAIICHNCHVTRNIISTADAIGVRVPEDLSIVAQGYGPMRFQDPSRPLTCVRYDFPRAIELALDLLFEQARTRQCSLTRCFVGPVLVEGGSLAAPKPARREVRVATTAGH